MCILFRTMLSSFICVLVAATSINSKEISEDIGQTRSGSRVVDSLQFVVVVSRHGNRGAQMGDYPLDPYPMNDTKLWPYGPQNLTPYGRVQMYNLGKAVRSLYDGYLPTEYSPLTIRASSTPVDRLLMSGEGFLAGLYPPMGYQVWDENMPWQPATMYSDSKDNSPTILVCPRYLAELQQCMVPLYNKYHDNLTQIIEVVHNSTGVLIDGDQAYGLWDKLISEDIEGYALPEWTKKLYPQPMQFLIGELCKVYYAGNDEMVRLLIGNFYREMMDVVASKANGTLNQGLRMAYYSGHDCSIISLQKVFGVAPASYVSLVKPGSALLLELHQHPLTKEHTIQVLYMDGSTDLKPIRMPLPACGKTCALDTLMNLTAPFRQVVDYQQECQMPESLHR